MNIDELMAGYTPAQAPVTPSAGSSLSIDSLMADYKPHSEARALGNAALTGTNNLLSFVNEFDPIEAGWSNGFPTLSPQVPNLFGLSEYLGLKAKPAPTISDLVAGTSAKKEPFSDMFDRVTTDAGLRTEDKPQTETGKLAGNVIEQAIPSALFGPMSALVGGVSGGFGAYGGEKVAPMLGVTPSTGKAVGSIAGNFLPALGLLGLKTASTLAGPLTKGGAEASVGRLLRESAEDPAATQAALREFSPSGPLDSFKTTAEVGKGGLARLEDAFIGMDPTDSIPAVNAERAATRQSIIENLAPTAEKQVINDALEAKIAEGRAVLKASADEAWANVPKETPVIVDHRLPEVEDVLSSYYGTEPNSIPSVFKQVRDGIAQSAAADSELNIGQVQKWRSNLGKLAANSTDGTESSAAKELRRVLDDALNDNAALGIADGGDVTALRDAIAATHLDYQTFNPKVAPTVGKAAGINKTPLQNTQLLNQVSTSRDALEAVINAGEVSGVAMNDPIRQAMVRQIMVSSTGAPTTDLQMIREWGKLKEKLSPDLLRAAVGEDAFNTIEATVADVQSQADRVSSAMQSAQRNSATTPRAQITSNIQKAKGLASEAKVDRMPLGQAAAAVGGTAGAFSAGTVGGGVGTLAGSVAGTLAKNAFKEVARAKEAQFMGILQNAIRNPNEAARLMSINPLAERYQEAAKLFGQTGSLATSKLAGSQAQQLFAPQLPINTAPKVTMTQEPTKPVLPSVISAEAKAQPVSYSPIVHEDFPYGEFKKRVALAESSGDPKAVGPTTKYGTAKGLFQFIDSTARAYGITDPFDPIQSSNAFDKMFADLYTQFKDPKLAMVAYNWGSGKLAKLLAKNPGASYAEIKGLIPTATRKYVDKIFKPFEGSLQA